MKPLRLIIVEDSEDDTILLVHKLESAGYEIEYIRVETAGALSEALQDREWDLVLADHGLPRFSAPEALTVLNSSGKEVPLIIVSSVIGEEVAVAAMKAGAHDYIMKDNLNRLVPVVERALHDAEVRAEKRRAQDALRESEARFRLLAENAQDLVYRVRFYPERCFEYVSPSSKELIGYTPEEHYKNPNLAFEIVHPDDYQLLEAISNNEIKGSEPIVLRWLHKEGSVVWIEQRNVPVYDEDGKLLAIEGIARDVTERVLSEKRLKESHARIKALSNRILEAMEEERARLARELHDELGQALTAVKLDLQLLREQIPAIRGHENKFNQTLELVDYTINLVRRQSTSLRPPALDDMGLLPAINEMVKGFEKRTGINADIKADGFSKRLPQPVETALYRCIQESLTNVARHANANNISVELKEKRGEFLVSVADDGVGFEPSMQQISSGSIGLTGMQERVKLLAGEMKLESAIGRGTSILIRIPWKGLFNGEEAK